MAREELILSLSLLITLQDCSDNGPVRGLSELSSKATIKGGGCAKELGAGAVVLHPS